MLRMRRSVQAGILTFPGLLLLVLALNGTSRAEEECGPQVQNKCSTCHFVTHICPRIERGKGSLYWKRIIDNMMADGMVATDLEQEQLTRCLASPDAKVKALCPKP
ncbi:MAG: hypothetical protein PHI97_13205 [Desulfobulbus sp.]|nr:hypothetical protein [Desulfobulbus sp.]